MWGHVFHIFQRLLDPSSEPGSPDKRSHRHDAPPAPPTFFFEDDEAPTLEADDVAPLLNMLADSKDFPHLLRESVDALSKLSEKNERALQQAFSLVDGNAVLAPLWQHASEFGVREPLLRCGRAILCQQMGVQEEMLWQVLAAEAEKGGETVVAKRWRARGAELGGGESPCSTATDNSSGGQVVQRPMMAALPVPPSRL